jgi:hypothetical protein
MWLMSRTTCGCTTWRGRRDDGSPRRTTAAGLVKRAERDTPARIHVIANWIETLKTRAALR